MANSISHASLPYPIKNARYTVLVPYLDADGDPTDPTTPDTEVSQDGGSFADAAEEVTTITGSNGLGYVTLTGAETNNSAVGLAFKVASGPKATLMLLYPRNLPILESGTAGAGAAGSITLASGTYTGINLAGCFVRTTGGTGGGGTGGASNQARRITSYNTGTRVATVTPNWETTPDNTTTYDILLPEGILIPMLTALAPTTLARTLDVSAGGEAGLDWANVGSPTTTLALTGTTIATTQKVDLETIKTQAVTCAAGVTIRADVGAAGAPGAANGMFIAGTNAATTITTSGGSALTLSSSGANGSGLLLTGNGSGHGLAATGGATGHGLYAAGGATSGNGIYALGAGTGDGLHCISGAGSGAHAFYAQAQGTGESHGMYVLGSATGDGMHCLSGTGTGAHGVHFEGQGAGVSHGALFDGNTGGDDIALNGDDAPDLNTVIWGSTTTRTLTATGLAAITAWIVDITGNLTGNVSGSVGSVTGAVGSVTGNVGGNVVGSVGSVTGAVGSVTGAVGSVTGAVGSIGTGGIAATSFAAGAIDAAAIANGAIDAATFAAGAIDATAIATDAIDADALKADAVTEIWGKAMAELSAVPGVTGSVLEALTWVFTLARNKATQTATTQTLYKDDGTTPLATSTVSDDATTYTRGEFS